MFIFCCTFLYSQQKIGLVLSGGGATGLAHIGVLKALEENGVKIDYITGTSAGSLVGALYASGYSPEEIEAYVLTEDFQLITTGKNKPNQRFLIREEEETSSLLSLDFSANEPLNKSLPTNFTSSSFLDFEMFKLLAPASAQAKNDFDSLFIPFRCVASDITAKESIVYSKGNLNEVVRASITFPFYFSPIKIDGKLLFDGGLYNNFPSNVMYDEFNADYIIGSNVSYNAPAPSEDDLIGQVINMLVFHTDFSLPCQSGIIIEPQTDVHTFDFENVKTAINDGYLSTIQQIDSIKKNISNITTKEEITKERNNFRSKLPTVYIDQISTENNENDKRIVYAERSMINKNKKENLTLADIEKRYFNLYNSQLIDFIFPTLYHKNDSIFKMNLNIRKQKNLKLDVGGHFSSRAVNTGYLGLTYKHLGRLGSSLKAESYFGKFYGSIKTLAALEIPSKFPVTLSGYFVMNRWDYFRNFATFFEKVRPSFLVQNEIYSGIKLETPIGNNQKLTIDGRYFSLEDDYYQTLNFSNSDTTDKTYFLGSSIRLEFLNNSLNRKQFASAGHFLSIKIKYINGEERYIDGSSTTNNPIGTSKHHQWLSINSELQTFIIDKPTFHLGVHAKGVFNTQSLFSNYTSSLLSMSSFSPVPDIETFFLSEYRSPQHIGSGLNIIFSVKKKLDLRIDAYYYQPFVTLVQDKENNTFGYSKPFKGNEILASFSTIYHSFFGPIRATLNYFPQQSSPLSFQVSYGYVLFNERAVR